MSQYNTYRFTSVRMVREALKSFRDLAQLEDEVSTTIFLDLTRALGDDPQSPVKILTKHQRHLVQQNLIDNIPVSKVAKLNNIAPRVVHYAIARALRSLLQFLESDEQITTNVWQPWMIDLMRDPYRSTEEIAELAGKSVHAVKCAMTRYRKSENIPLRATRKPNTRRKPE
jgi:DNA-directed RNA polymerase specialized sigma24 family protein